MAEQLKLLDVSAPWESEWIGMPEFSQEDLTPWRSIVVHFASPGDMETFSRLIEQNISTKTKSVWYPEAEIGRFANKRYADES